MKANRWEATMAPKLKRLAVVACWAVLGCSAADGQTRVNADAQVLKDFQTRIDEYRKLHEKAEDRAQPLKKTEDPAKIKSAQADIASRIKAARSTAKAGDIFTPETRQLFRRLMYPELKGEEGRETKETIKDDAPKGVSLKVNATYPEGAPLPTVPPNLLAALPKLPEDLEYRIVNKDLILRDVDANLIVDFIPNAIR